MGTSETGIYTLNLEIRETQENIVWIELQRKENRKNRGHQDINKCRKTN